jgi:uncharacterized RDD family membrane protein YckC
MVVARPQQARRPAPVHPRVRREKVEHPTLDFPVQGAHTLKTSVEAAIYCNAPVALASQRCVAALIDTLIGVAGAAVFAATFHFAGFPLDFSNQSLSIFALAAVLISLLYRAAFCLGNCDSIGLQAAGLRIVHFDGRRPTRWERAYRVAGGLLSAGALCVGLLWALGDEEKLTWHDLITQTFPTP